MTKPKIPDTIPYHCEYLWALMKPNGKGGITMMYRFSTSANDVWAAVVDEETYGSGWTKESLKRDGWVARRVRVEEVPK